MTIYSARRGLAEGIEKTVNTGILLCTAVPGPVMAALADGTEKVLIIHYNGDHNGISFDPQRKDGLVTLLRPGDAGYRLPPSFDPHDSSVDIRSGVPLWLVKPGADECLVLGVGKLHTRWNAATIDLYDLDSRRHLIQMFFADPRIDMSHPPDGHPSFAEQKRQILEAGGAVEPPPMLAPRYPDFHFLSSQLNLD